MRKLLSVFLFSNLVFGAFPGDFPADAGTISIPVLSATTSISSPSGVFTAGSADATVLSLRAATAGIARWNLVQGTSNTYFEYAGNFASANAVISLNAVLGGAGTTVYSINYNNGTYTVGSGYNLVAAKGRILTAASTGTMEISADLDVNLGANLKMWAFGHASAARDWALRFDSTNILSYDHSETDMFAAVPLVFAQGFRHTAASVALTADDQAVTVASRGMITLTSDDATAANRTFTLAAGGQAGQELLLYWNSANEGELLDTGTTLLTAAWAPTNIGQTLRLVFDGTNWTEVSRADPT